MRVLILLVICFFVTKIQKNDRSDFAKKTVKSEKKWDHVKRGINGTKLVYYTWDNKLKKRNKFFLEENFFKQIKEWNINVVRCFIGMDKDSLSDYEKFKPITQRMENLDLAALYKDHFDGLDSMLKMAEKYNFDVIVTLGKLGGRSSNEVLFERNLAFLWDFISKKYGTHAKLIGYDLLNEPNTPYEKKVWKKSGTIDKLIKIIRKNDTNTFIVLEPCPWSICQSFNSLAEIKEDNKIIYSPHFYEPHCYTHQGIKQYKDLKGGTYPGNLKDYKNSPAMFYNKEMLLEHLKPVINFQKTTNCKILIGEFGVARWAPGGDKYLSDLISIFEENNWSWCYHSYGEPYNGFNPTFSPSYDKMSGIDGGVVTDNLKVLLQGWKNNVEIPRKEN